MDVVESKVEKQVQFWSLLGPFFILLATAVLIFKVSTHWYFPVCALIGIPLCVKWKMKGMAVALGCLFFFSAVTYPSLELDDRYWHVGLSLAIAFSFIVMTLALEEVQSLIDKLQLESQSRLDNFLLLDEQWKTAEHEWQIAKEQAKKAIAALTQEATVLLEDKQMFYKLAQLAKEELVQFRGQHDQLLKEILYKKQQISQLHERLNETEMTIQGFVNSDSEKQIALLTERVTYLEQEKNECKAKANAAQQKLNEEKSIIQDLEAKIKASEKNKSEIQQNQHTLLQQNKQQQSALMQEVKTWQERCTALQEDCSKINRELQGKNNDLSQIRESVSGLSHELEDYRSLLTRNEEKIKQLENLKSELEQALVQAKSKQEEKKCHEALPYADGNTRHIESMYIQLKQQFQQKCDVLDTTRRELFHVNEQLSKFQRENEEEKLYYLSTNENLLQRHFVQLGRQFDQMQELYQQEMDELTLLIGNLLRQIK